ncbi:uncharacterized protein C8R40DRAFT_1178665 [Lentinula edodes]|uniref:uncharacterized protein n=1 Tax=Lentinula edodes TaxID=5353 RepID=UPI001E8E6386|nr:uncharacterized protein C8R40DRAFT_1178665 [Lentinula edodes]KAH7867752.1 hypothetical protein C8R40DRAFT_1178665 [Lentinula edodes]
MLDERDTADADQQELQKFLALQQDEAAITAKCKRNCSPLPVAGPSSKKIWSDAPKKCSHRKSPVAEATPESPLCIQLVVPLGQLVVASTSIPVPPRTSPSLMEVPHRDLPMQGPSDLVWLAAVAEAHSGLVQQAVSSSSARTPIKGAGQDLLSSNMPPTPHPTLCLAARFLALNEALLKAPGRSLLECFWKVQEDLRDATRKWKVAVEKLSTSTRKNSQLTATLLHQQGLVHGSNALATRQHHLVEELQEEVHRAHGCAAFADQIIKEYPDEGYYGVILPPILQLKGDLNKACEDLCYVATFAHHLYHSNPATVLHHHRYIGVIIEAVVAFLRCGPNSENLNVVVHSFQLALDYMRAAQGVHGDLYMRSISSIQWFFSNTVDEDEGLYRMVLEHSRFDNDAPFLTAAQHGGFAPPPDDSLEPLLHRQMLALSTALLHSGGAGRWDDIVPALPSIDQLTADWEQLMLQYIHHITNTPLSGPDTQAPMLSVEPVTKSLGEVSVEQSLEALVALVSSPSVGSNPQVPLFLPEQESPTSPSPPPPSPNLPPLFDLSPI